MAMSFESAEPRCGWLTDDSPEHQWTVIGIEREAGFDFFEDRTSISVVSCSYHIERCRECQRERLVPIAEASPYLTPMERASANGRGS